MELKPVDEVMARLRLYRLNRTFYGIETAEVLIVERSLGSVLIVPFMELKPRCER